MTLLFNRIARDPATHKSFIAITEGSTNVSSLWSPTTAAISTLRLVFRPLDVCETGAKAPFAGAPFDVRPEPIDEEALHAGHAICPALDTVVVVSTGAHGRGPMITSRLGLSVAAGVPVLVLVSMGPVAGLAGTASIAVWTVSSVIGFVMALAFAELLSSFPSQSGGIGVLTANVLAHRSRALARLSGWSYWFGWSPALAINGLLIGQYLHDLVMPSAPPWTATVAAGAVLVISATVNHFGLRPGAGLQSVLAACVVIATAVLVGGAILRGGFTVERLTPFAPPGGWGSGQGIVAVLGALFVAGWSAYGSELALSYGTEYRGGTRDAVETLALVAVCGVAAYTLVPLALVGVVGVARIQDDPARALTPLLQQSAGGAADAVVAMLVVALLLGLNMVTITSSRSLCQLARRGEAWAWLGDLNSRGVPGNALRFDLLFNLFLLIVVTAMNGGQTTAVPIALLAAANVGYIASICLALVAAWMNHRHPRSTAGTLRVRDGLIRLCPALVAVNAVLLVAAGFAWGWSNVGLGILILAIVTVVGPSRLAMGGRDRSASRLG